MQRLLRSVSMGLWLIVTTSACAGQHASLIPQSSGPLVNDYLQTSPAPRASVQPQSLCIKNPDGGYNCGCDSAITARKGAPETPAGCGNPPPAPGYDTLGESTCNVGGGIYISLEADPASNAQVYCASTISPVVTTNSPNGCPVYVAATWPGVTGSGNISITGSITENYPGTKEGIRISLSCTYYIDLVEEGTLLARRHA